MAELGTGYMGLDLRTPLVASASPLTGDLATLRALEDHGVGAAVLPSVFEEDVVREQHVLDELLRGGEGIAEVGGSFFPAMEHAAGELEHRLELIAKARAGLDMPIVASLNGVSDSGWLELARAFEEAGARAIELNVYDLPIDLAQSAREVEQGAILLVERVCASVRVPVAVKLSPYYSALGELAVSLQRAGAAALVLFNRFYHPDLDLIRLRPVHDLQLSRRHEMRLPMRWLAALRGRLDVSLAATTGVETADDVVRYLLAGADAVMTTSALLRNGPAYARTLVDSLAQWVDARGYASVDEIRGLLASPDRLGGAAREREAYRAELGSFDPALRGTGSPGMR